MRRSGLQVYDFSYVFIHDRPDASEHTEVRPKSAGALASSSAHESLASQSASSRLSLRREFWKQLP